MFSSRCEGRKEECSAHPLATSGNPYQAQIGMNTMKKLYENNSNGEKRCQVQILRFEKLIQNARMSSQQTSLDEVMISEPSSPRRLFLIQTH